MFTFRAPLLKRQAKDTPLAHPSPLPTHPLLGRQRRGWWLGWRPQANVMRLLENVRGKHSSDRTIATAMKFGNIIKKVPVLVGNCPGFVGNRMLGFYSKSARDVLMQVCTPQPAKPANQ